MTQPRPQPLAHTRDGQPIFPAFAVPAGHAQPLGVMADGRPVWPIGAGSVPHGQPQPLGVLADGQFLYARTNASLANKGKPLWKKKRVLIPAGLVGFLLCTAVAGAAAAAPKTTGAALDSPTTAPTVAATAQTAADRAAADKAAADKIAADKAAAAQAARVKTAADKVAKAAAAKAAAAKAARDKPVALTSREFAKLMKDPDSYIGRNFIVYGEVTQFDSATGEESFLANSGAVKDRISYGFTNYSENTLYQGAAGLLKDVVEGDVFRATIAVLGSKSYDTQIGGNTTVPLFQLRTIAVYGSTA